MPNRYSPKLIQHETDIVWTEDIDRFDYVREYLDQYAGTRQRPVRWNNRGRRVGYSVLAAARARGRHGGRRKSLTQRQVLTLYRMYDSREHTVAEIAETLGTSRATVYRELEHRESQNSSGAGKA